MLEKVKEILQDFTEIPMNKINLETNLVRDLELNSLDVMNIVVAFEDEFKIEIPDRAIRSLTTVGDIIEYLANHV